jgi:hypothetical protein
MMYSVAVWGLSIAVVVDCATAGRLFPWPAPRDFWRVCGLLGIGCAAGVWAGFSRRGSVGPADNRVALALAIGFLVRGVINVLGGLTR